MKILELSKNYCKKYYNGNYEEMIKEKDGIIWNSNKNTTEKQLKRYIEDNKVFCKFYDLKNEKFI